MPASLFFFTLRASSAGGGLLCGGGSCAAAYMRHCGAWVYPTTHSLAAEDELRSLPIPQFVRAWGRAFLFI